MPKRHLCSEACHRYRQVAPAQRCCVRAACLDKQWRLQRVSTQGVAAPDNPRLVFSTVLFMCTCARMHMVCVCLCVCVCVCFMYKLHVYKKNPFGAIVYSARNYLVALS